VPAPGGAGLALIPMYLSFEIGDTIIRSPLFCGVWMMVVAALMVSRIPTFSMKRFRVPHHYVVPIMLAVGIVAAFLTTAPWPTLAVVGIAYAASIPFTVRSYNRLRRAAELAEAERRHAEDAEASSGATVTALPEQRDSSRANP
jgi:CDP-diacylglycerol--serine O-phosphatidyltransferase